MQIIKKYNQYAQYLFYAAFAIHMAIMGVGLSAWDVPFRGRLLQIAFGLCCVKILMTYYSKIEWLVMFILAAFAGASYACSKEKYFVYVLVLLLAAKSVDLKKSIQTLLLASFLSGLVVVLLSLGGIGDQIFETRDFGRGIVETRYSFGFGHPNNCHGTIWYVTSLFIYVFRDKLKWKAYTVLSVINIIIFMLTASKAGLIATQLMIIAGVCYAYWNRLFFEKSWIYILGITALAGIVILTIVSLTVNCWGGYGPILSAIDKATTGRLMLAYQSAYIGDLNPLSAGGSHKFLIDNGFAALPADYGYIIAFIYIAFIVWQIIVTMKEKNGICFAMVMTCVFYTFMEKTYTLNDAYLLSNLSYIYAMIYFSQKVSRETDNWE